MSDSLAGALSGQSWGGGVVPGTVVARPLQANVWEWRNLAFKVSVNGQLRTPQWPAGYGPRAGDTVQVLIDGNRSFVLGVYESDPRPAVCIYDGTNLDGSVNLYDPATNTGYSGQYVGELPEEKGTPVRVDWTQSVPWMIGLAATQTPLPSIGTPAPPQPERAELALEAPAWDATSMLVFSITDWSQMPRLCAGTIPGGSIEACWWSHGSALYPVISGYYAVDAELFALEELRELQVRIPARVQNGEETETASLQVGLRRGRTRDNYSFSSPWPHLERVPLALTSADRSAIWVDLYGIWRALPADQQRDFLLEFFRGQYSVSVTCDQGYVTFEDLATDPAGGMMRPVFRRETPAS